jgi:mitogen-activated protein kinase 1/3
MTEYVVTRWYRAPELLLSCEDYTSAIDIWSMGCILAEILGRKPLFPGKDYIHQMRLIVEVLGSPNEEDCAFIQSTKARNYIRTLPHSPQVRWERMFPKGNPQAIDLLDKMLQFDPKKRITVEQALEHPYLTALHDPMVEPASEPAPFEFEFEDEELQEEQLREKVWEEMLSFHGEGSFGRGRGSGVTPMMS